MHNQRLYDVRRRSFPRSFDLIMNQLPEWHEPLDCTPMLSLTRLPVPALLERIKELPCYCEPRTGVNHVPTQSGSAFEKRCGPTEDNPNCSYGTAELACLPKWTWSCKASSLGTRCMSHNLENDIIRLPRLICGQSRSTTQDLRSNKVVYHHGNSSL
jgi:hypothetical protein